MLLDRPEGGTGDGPERDDHRRPADLYLTAPEPGAVFDLGARVAVGGRDDAPLVLDESRARAPLRLFERRAPRGAVSRLLF